MTTRCSSPSSFHCIALLVMYPIIQPHHPLLLLLLLQPIGGAIRALVLAPTRELTAQIKAEAVKLLTPHGNKMGVQVRELSLIHISQGIVR